METEQTLREQTVINASVSSMEFKMSNLNENIVLKVYLIRNQSVGNLIMHQNMSHTCSVCYQIYKQRNRSVLHIAFIRIELI